MPSTCNLHRSFQFVLTVPRSSRRRSYPLCLTVSCSVLLLSCLTVSCSVLLLSCLTLSCSLHVHRHILHRLPSQPRHPAERCVTCDSSGAPAANGRLAGCPRRLPAQPPAGAGAGAGAEREEVAESDQVRSGSPLADHQRLHPLRRLPCPPPLAPTTPLPQP